MNTKPLFYLGCFLAVTITTSTVDAGQRRHRGGGNHTASKSARISGGARSFAGHNRMRSGNGQRFSGQRFVTNRNWNGGNWNNHHWNGQRRSGQRFTTNHWSNNWNWNHHHHRRSSVFVNFGFPFWGWWGYPYYYDYYPYGYYGGGYYGNGYFGSYNYNYGNGYGYDNGYGNGYGSGNGNGYNSGYDAKVAELQRRLSNAGYYRGEIDGIWGSRTQYALKAYRHDHPNGNDNNNYGGSSPTLRDRPYSPPPVTTEPTE